MCDKSIQRCIDIIINVPTNNSLIAYVLKKLNYKNPIIKANISLFESIKHKIVNNSIYIIQYTNITFIQVLYFIKKIQYITNKSPRIYSIVLFLLIPGRKY